MEWINIEDNQPEKTEQILVYANDIVSGWVEQIQAYICPEYGNLILMDRDGEDYVPIVTYWMPLPEPPKE